MCTVLRSTPYNPYYGKWFFFTKIQSVVALKEIRKPCLLVISSHVRGVSSGTRNQCEFDVTCKIEWICSDVIIIILHGREIKGRCWFLGSVERDAINSELLARKIKPDREEYIYCSYN